MAEFLKRRRRSILENELFHTVTFPREWSLQQCARAAIALAIDLGKKVVFTYACVKLEVCRLTNIQAVCRMWEKLTERAAEAARLGWGGWLHVLPADTD